MTWRMGPMCWCVPRPRDEAAYLLSPDDEQNEDCPESAGRDITWQQAEDSEDVTERAVVLWLSLIHI